MGLFARILSARSSVLQLTGVAVVLGFAVSLLATWAGSVLPKVVQVFLASLLVLLVMCVVAARTFGRLEERTVIEAAVIIHNGKFVSINNYMFSEDVERVLNAATTENEALQRQWSEHPIVTSGEGPNIVDGFQGAGAHLLREVIEFVYFDKLSTHLTDYFNGTPLRAAVVEYNRSDLMHLLPGNRVLDQLSRPIEDRIALIQASAGGRDADRHFVQIVRQRTSHTGQLIEEVVYASDGTYVFSKADLELPKGTRVERSEAGGIRLKGKYFDFEMQVNLNSRHVFFSPAFYERYIRVPWDDFRGRGAGSGEACQVDLVWVTRIRWRALLSVKAWKLYDWSESFVEKCRRDMAIETFLDRINWPVVEAVLFSMRARTRSAADVRTGPVAGAEIADVDTGPEPTRPGSADLK